MTQGAKRLRQASSVRYKSSLAPDPVGQPAGKWRNVLWDDFEGTAVNYAKWGPWYPIGQGTDPLTNPAGPHTNNPGREKQYYDTTGASVSDSILTLTATYDNIHNDIGLPYTSGMVQSSPSGPSLYGYFEAKMKIPQLVAGQWPAFWLSSAVVAQQPPVGEVTLGWPPEIDVMEQFGTITTPDVTTWQNGSPAEGSIQDVLISGYDQTEWHTYAVEWTPTALTFYYDGNQVAQETDVNCVPQTPMHLFCTFAVDGSDTIITSEYPVSVLIDYIGAWQFLGETDTGGGGGSTPSVANSFASAIPADGITSVALPVTVANAADDTLLLVAFTTGAVLASVEGAGTGTWTFLGSQAVSGNECEIWKGIPPTGGWVLTDGKADLTATLSVAANPAMFMLDLTDAGAITATVKPAATGASGTATAETGASAGDLQLIGMAAADSFTSQPTAPWTNVAPGPDGTAVGFPADRSGGVGIAYLTQAPGSPTTGTWVIPDSIPFFTFAVRVEPGTT